MKDESNPTITPAVKVAMTDEAQDFVDSQGDIDAFKAMVEEEIEGLKAGSEDGPSSIYDIFFHVMSWKGEYNMIIVPNSDGDCLIIDLCIMEDRGEITEGPMKGKRMMYPTPYSQRKVQ